MSTGPRPFPFGVPEQYQVLIQLGVATMFLFLGGTVFLASLGIIRSGEPMGWGAHIVTFLFGGFMSAVGVVLAAIPLRALAHDAGATGLREIVALGARRLVRRVTRDSAIAGALMIPLVIGYWFAATGRDFWLWPRQALIDLVLIEFLLIHGFVFLAVGATFAQGSTGGARRAWLGGMAVLILLYGLMAIKAGGIFGVIGLAYLVAPNVVAFLHPTQGWSVRALVVSRWGWKFVTFLGSAMLLNERSLEGSGNLRVGLLYFAVQAIGDAIRVAELPFDISAAWADLPPERRKPLISLQSGES